MEEARCQCSVRMAVSLNLGILLTSANSYYSIRIDPVHYCEREDILEEKRKRGSFLDRNAEPENAPEQRLKLLCRTIRHDDTGNLGLITRFLKISYMTREACKVDLARIVAVMPNLRYVDLPDGFFTGDSSCRLLREELQVRCQQIRKMTYNKGTEPSFEILARGTIWQRLEVLELCNLDIEPITIRYALCSLQYLRALKLKNMAHNDGLFLALPNAPPFPALTELLMENTPNISILALVGWLTSPDAKASLNTISLTGSGVGPEFLHEVLSCAPNLAKVSIIAQVQYPLPTEPHQRPLLKSKSLQTLHYEVTSRVSKVSRATYIDPTTSYYSYLASSLLSNGLPRLQALYVREPDFADRLLSFAPPRPAFAADSPKRPLSSNNPFAAAASNGIPGLQQQLEVYTKGVQEDSWNFSYVEPAHNGKRGSLNSLRPVSSYGLSTSSRDGPRSPSWAASFGGTGNVRRSVMVGNGAGGFLAVPGDDGEWSSNRASSARPGSSASERRGFLSIPDDNGPRPGSVASFARPGSSAGENRASQYDMWR